MVERDPQYALYAAGDGEINTVPFTGNFGTASLSYQADNGNSILCPASDASTR